jgi:hypothetical protein
MTRKARKKKLPHLDTIEVGDLVIHNIRSTAEAYGMCLVKEFRAGWSCQEVQVYSFKLKMDAFFDIDNMRKMVSTPEAEKVSLPRKGRNEKD